MKGNVLLLFLLVALATQLQAQATLSVQGTIQKSFGAAVDDGTYSLTFNLYESLTGGTPVWTETQNDVEVIGGVYSVLLGEVTPLTAAFNTTYYLGVAVNGGAELIPRARLTSSPYALSLIGQGNTFPSTGTVGVGTASPDTGYQLHIKNASGDGNLLLEGSATSKIEIKKGTAVASLGFTNQGDNIFRLQPGANNTSLFHGNNERLRITNGGASIFGELTGNNDLFFNSGAEYMDAEFRSNIGSQLRLLKGDGSSGSLILTANNNNNGYVASKEDLIMTSHSGNSRFELRADDALLNQPLTIAAFDNKLVGVHSALTLGGVITVGNPTFSSSVVALSCNGEVVADIFRANSDRRIKREIKFSDGEKDLAMLMKLRVSDYRKVDFISNGNSVHKGFIAQEVAEVFPEAVSKSEDYIPDVFAPAVKTLLDDGKMIIELEKPHGFAVGDEVKIIADENIHLMKVTGTPTPQSFTLAWQKPAVKHVFVYGKKVNDFCSVDYDRIHTLNVSATQELARRLAQLETENAALRLQNEKLQQQNDGLRSDVNGMNERLLKLENLMTGNAQR